MEFKLLIIARLAPQLIVSTAHRTYGGRIQCVESLSGCGGQGINLDAVFTPHLDRADLIFICHGMIQYIQRQAPLSAI